MLYLLGGASRTGKSWIAKRLLQSHGIPFLSLDWLVMGFTNGLPDLGIHDKLMPEEIAARMSPFVEQMCESMIWVGDDCVIEGESMLPDLARRLMDRHPNEVRACFLGYSSIDVEKKVDEIKRFNPGQQDWLTNESDAFMREHIKNMRSFSVSLKAKCQAAHQSYIETSDDLFRAQETAIELLTGSLTDPMGLDG